MMEGGDIPIQHSRRAQGFVLTTSGGSTPTFRHRHRATLHVFICCSVHEEVSESVSKKGEKGGERKVC